MYIIYIYAIQTYEFGLRHGKVLKKKHVPSDVRDAHLQAMGSIANPSIDRKEIFGLRLLRDDAQALCKLIYSNLPSAHVNEIPKFFSMLDFQGHKLGFNHIVGLHCFHVFIVS